ncbi:MAG: protease modulator HflC [Acidobacteriota bacterium]
MNARRGLIIAVVALAVALLPTCLFTVREGEVALVTRFGAPQHEAEPGLHAKLPWPIDSVIRVDRRLLVFDNEPTEMLTGDKKNVLVDSFLVWRVDDPLRFAQTVKTRLEAEARLLDLTVSELGAAVGGRPMDDFLAAGAEGAELVTTAEEARIGVDGVARESFGIEVVDLQINGFVLPLQNRKSVIERMRAERSRIATTYRSEGEERALGIEAESAAEVAAVLAEARSKAEAVRGEGEAEALRLLAEAYRKDPELYRFLRTLETYETILDEDTTIFLDADSDLMEALDGR